MALALALAWPLPYALSTRPCPKLLASPYVASTLTRCVARLDEWEEVHRAAAEARRLTLTLTLTLTLPMTLTLTLTLRRAARSPGFRGHPNALASERRSNRPWRSSLPPMRRMCDRCVTFCENVACARRETATVHAGL